MSTTPEFVVRDRLVSGAGQRLGILVQYTGQVFHFVTLRIQLSNVIEIRKRVLPIKFRQIKNEFGLWHRVRLCRLMR